MRNTLGPLAMFLAIVVMSGCAGKETRKQQHLAHGNELFKEGKYPAAIIEYRSALQLDDHFGPARLQLGLAYQKNEQLDLALMEFVRAADLMPSDREAQLRAGNFLLAALRFEDAASRAQRVLDNDPLDVDALMLLGNASGQLKDSDAAAAVLKRAIGQLPAEPRLQETIGAFESGRGNREAAEAALKRAVDIAPKSIQAREALATFYWTFGRVDDAERVLRDALNIDASSDSVARDLATLYFVQGRDKDAEPILTAILKRTPHDSSTLLALGDVYTRGRRFDEAIKAFQQASGDPAAAKSSGARIAYVHWAEGHKETGYNELKEALKQDPKNTDAGALMARLLLDDQRPAEAEAAARATLQVAQDRMEALYVLGTALMQQGREPEAFQPIERAATLAPGAPGPKIELAILYYNKGDLENARAYAEAAVKVNPNQPDVRLMLVKTFLAQKNILRAEQEIKPLLQLAPNMAGVQAMAGDVAGARGDREAARRYYTRALEIRPDTFDAIRGLVTSDLMSKQTGDAVSLVKQAIDRSPSSTEVLMLAASTYVVVRDDRTAEGLLQKVLKTPNAPFDAYVMLADLYMRQHQLDAAKTQMEAAAAKYPKAPGPPTMVGVILQMQGRTKDAQATYERLLQTTPDAPLAANNLAMLLLESGGNVDVALNHAQAATKAMPGNANFADTLGLVYLKKGLWSMAVPAFESSTKAQPQSAEFWLHLGQAYAGSGNKSKAAEALQRALKIDQQSPLAAEARRALDGLNKKAS